MTTTAKMTTATELWERPDDGWRHELVAGELLTMPFFDDEHGGIAAAVAAS